MSLPAVVRSLHTWDTFPPGDLRVDEEAVVVSAEDFAATHGYRGTWSRWVLISLDRPRLVKVTSVRDVATTVKRWLRPVA